MSVCRIIMGPTDDADRDANLELPDGRLLSQVRRIELYAALQMLHVPGIAASQTKDELSELYRAKLVSVRDELCPKNSGAQLTQPMMRQAVAFLEAQQ